MIPVSLPFIVFEGIDGSGKSTLCEAVFRHFDGCGIACVRLREPTGGKWGRKIRELLQQPQMPDAEEQLHLFLLDREEDVERNILPAMREGSMILMDRYYFSNAAYQGAAGIPPERIIAENRDKGFPEPHRVYLIDVEPGEALRRVALRNGLGKSGEVFEREGFLSEVRRIYRSIADDRFCVVDGSKTPGECLEIILEDMRKTFAIK